MIDYCDDKVLAWLSWIGTVVTVLGTIFGGIGLFLTWKQAKDARIMAESAKSAAQLAESAAKATINSIKDRLLIADIRSAVKNLHILKSVVLSPSHDNIVHVGNAFRSDINSTVRSILTYKEKVENPHQIGLYLKAIWGFIDACALDEQTDKHRRRFLDSLDHIENFLSEHGEKLTFQVASEAQNGTKVSC